VAVADAFYAMLAGRVQVTGAECVSFDEVQGWPGDDVRRALGDGVLREIEPGSGFVCDQCGESHYVEVDRLTDPDTQEAVGVYFCPDPEEGGRHTVALERLRRWEIVAEKLRELGDLTTETDTASAGKKKVRDRPSQGEMKRRNAAVATDAQKKRRTKTKSASSLPELTSSSRTSRPPANALQ